MTDTVIIPIPYEVDRENLRIDSGTGDDSLRTLLQFMEEMATEGMDQAVERVFRATVCLFAAKAGTFTKCLETALIWESG